MSDVPVPPEPVGPAYYPPPAYVTPPADKKKKSKAPLLIGGVIVVALLVGGIVIATSGGGDGGLKLHGVYQLFDSGSDPSISGGVTNCRGTGGYSDIAGGMSIKVEDDNGKVVGSGTAEHYDSTEALLSELNSDSSDPVSADDFNNTLKEHLCVLKFDIPLKKADFYVLQVGHRSDVTYSYQELADEHFKINLTLGS